MELLEPKVFARFKTAANERIGSFLVLADEVAGMSPYQIYKHLCLESIPTDVQFVIAPKGTLLYHGIIGPQSVLGHPNKGGWQFKLADFIEEDNFLPWRPLQ